MHDTHEMPSGQETGVGRQARLISLAIALVMSLAFFLVTTAAGRYDDVARFGGSAWVFLLMMIVSLPTVTPLLKRRARR